MEHARAVFSAWFGIEATGFTVVAGENYDAMAPAYRDVTGFDLSHASNPDAVRTHAWVTYSAAGGAVVGLMYGGVSVYSLEALELSVAHEYFHVLQGQLASGFTQLPNGETAWGFPNDRGPTWLVEGLAVHADSAYISTRPGRRQFVGDYSFYLELAWQRAQDSDVQDDLAAELARIADRDAFHGCSTAWHAYALSFIASSFLIEQVAEDKESFVSYWNLLGERQTWQQAFEEAFGISVDDFYKAFDEWISSKPLPVPTMVRLKIQLRWPDQSTYVPGAPRFEIEDEATWQGTPISYVLSSSERDGTLYVIYPEGAVGSGILALWWIDGCNQYRLGWYKDGELTSVREESTVVEFAGISADLDWRLSGHPSTLPRLDCSGCDCSGFQSQ